VLSQYYEESFAVDLIAEHPEGVGYLLKECAATSRCSWTP
jgi:hypothetical protein